MTRSWFAVMLLTVSLLSGCKPEAKATNETTETITPDTPAPAAENDSESVTTQTTEIGDERSPNEGGALNDSGSGAPASTTASTPPPVTATRP